MKHLIALAPLSLAIMAATAAHAQTTAGAQPQKITLPAVQGSILSPVALATDDAREFEGQFVLETGKTLTVSRRGQRLFANVAGDTDVELVAIARSAFVTRDGKTEVKFLQAANGNVSGLQLRTGAPQLAQNTITSPSGPLR